MEDFHNGLNEVAAGCDVAQFREQYGTQIGYLGGIDKRAIAKGGQAPRFRSGKTTVGSCAGSRSATTD